MSDQRDPVKKWSNILFGFPMCGKGRFGRHMEKLWQFQTWVARDEIAKRKGQNTKFAHMAEEYEGTGRLIPHDKIMSLFKSTFQVSNKNNFDGIPRNCVQARDFVSIVTHQGINLKHMTVIHFGMSKEQSVERFKKKHSADDRKGRIDNTLDIHVNRLDLHEQQSKKTLDLLRRFQVKVFDIPFHNTEVEKLVMIQHYLHLPDIHHSYLTKVQLLEDQENDLETNHVSQSTLVSA